MPEQRSNNLPTSTTGTFTRRDGKRLLIFSGHGSWSPDDGYVNVPKGSRFCFFTENMKAISDGFGAQVEKWGVLYWAACRAIELKPTGGEAFGVNCLQR